MQGAASDLRAAVRSSDESSSTGLVTHAHEVGGHGLNVHSVFFQQYVQHLLQKDELGLKELNQADVHQQLPVSRVVQDAV